MTTEQIRAQFDEAASRATDAEEKALVEVAREYFTNPAFRRALEDRTFEATYKG